MRWPSAFRLIALIALCSMLFGCSGGSEEEGRIHVTPTEVTGVYRFGLERLEVKADGTFVQDISLNSQTIHRTGQWRILNHFLGGSEVLLLDAAIVSIEPAADKTSPPSVGDLRLYVHNRSGKVALARNEVADAYYERSQ